VSHGGYWGGRAAQWTGPHILNLRQVNAPPWFR
jgi:hypothetical protein